MHVHRIEVLGFQNGARSGSVALISKDRRITLPLSLDDSDRSDNDRLVSAAIRMTRRMPEFRSGAGRLSFAASLMTRAA